MDWVKINNEEEYKYTFTEYLKDKSLIDTSTEMFKNFVDYDFYSKAYIFLYYEQYKIYCIDNGFLFEERRELRC